MERKTGQIVRARTAKACRPQWGLPQLWDISMQHPSSAPLSQAGAAPSRRAVLHAIAVAPLALIASPALAAAGDGLVLHRGWVLRTDDLERLGRP
jgi:hypothetical protein